MQEETIGKQKQKQKQKQTKKQNKTKQGSRPIADQLETIMHTTQPMKRMLYFEPNIKSRPMILPGYFSYATPI